MKEFFNNKRNIIISVVSLVLVVAIVVVAVTFNNNKIDVDNSTTTTQGTTENTAQGDGTTTEEVTEESSGTSDKTQEEDETKNNIETSTKKPETTTKKPNKTETTTKKPVTTTKPEKSEEDDLKEWYVNQYGGEEGYKSHLKEIANYKCQYCGDHNCPSLEYGTDPLGNPSAPVLWPEKCPAIKAEKIKCSHCGKILVDNSDFRWQTEPDKYCRGNCHINFG